MIRFVPVIVTENPLESYSNERNSLLKTIGAVSDPARFMGPIIVTQAAWLETAVQLTAHLSGNATFIAAPDGSSNAILAAVGCVLADIECKDNPILLMDSRVDRARFFDLAREVSASASMAVNGAVTEFTATEECGEAVATGDYALSFESARAAYMDHSPMIMSYAAKAALHSISEGNVVRLNDAPFFLRDSGSFRDVLQASSGIVRHLHRQGNPDGLYTPWQIYSDSGFYAAPLRR